MWIVNHTPKTIKPVTNPMTFGELKDYSDALKGHSFDNDLDEPQHRKRLFKTFHSGRARTSLYANACHIRLGSALDDIIDLYDQKSLLNEPESGGGRGLAKALLYAGTTGSFFCCHAEDQDLYSYSHLVYGSPKVWYILEPSPYNLAKFYKHFVVKLPEAAYCNAPLRHKSLMINPKLLDKYGIKYSTVIQRVGEVVVVWPKAIHFGYNAGFNIR
jgi:hypothetical protein